MLPRNRPGVDAPNWVDRAVIRAIWARPNESVETIAQQVGAFTDVLRRVGGPATWSTISGTPWPDDATGHQDVVRTHPQRDADGADAPELGYRLTLVGCTDDADLTLRVSSGGPVVGRVTPRQHAMVTFTRTTRTSLDRTLVEGAVRFAVRAWQPIAVTLSDAGVNGEARRGDWLVPAGYRVWLRDDVGPITTVPNGLSMESVDGGTLIASDDSDDPPVIARLMAEFRTANGLDELPH